MKGFAISGYMDVLVRLLNKKYAKWSLIQIIIHALKKKYFWMMKFGGFSGSFTLMYKFFFCVFVAVFKSSTHKMIPFFASCKIFYQYHSLSYIVFASLIVTPVFFKESLRKVVLLVALTLSFVSIYMIQ